MPLIGIFGRFNGMRYVYGMVFAEGVFASCFCNEIEVLDFCDFSILFVEYDFVMSFVAGKIGIGRSLIAENCVAWQTRVIDFVSRHHHIWQMILWWRVQDVNNARNACHDSRNARIYRFWMLHLLELAGIKRQTSKLSCHARSRTERCWTCWWPAHEFRVSYHKCE